MDIVYFWDVADDVVKRGWVRVNDPFYEQMQVWVVPNGDTDLPEMNSPALFVPYKDFRCKPDVEAESDAETNDADDSIVHSPPRVAKKKPSATGTPKVLIEDVLTKLMEDSAGIISFTVISHLL
jgi:hypothetical protein